MAKNDMELVITVKGLSPVRVDGNKKTFIYDKQVILNAFGQKIAEALTDVLDSDEGIAWRGGKFRTQTSIHDG